MIRIVSVTPPPTPTVVRPMPPVPILVAPDAPRVAPVIAVAHIALPTGATQAYSAFAVAVRQNAPPPIAPGALLLPADPLPDLPALGIAAPDPQAIAAEKARRVDADPAILPSAYHQRPSGDPPSKQPATLTQQPVSQASLAVASASR
jgi:hypothetical protein